jgi:hypothetical protein
MGAGAHARTIEVKAWHLSMISRPDRVAGLIVRAGETAR